MEGTKGSKHGASSYDISGAHPEGGWWVSGQEAMAVMHKPQCINQGLSSSGRFPFSSTRPLPGFHRNIKLTGDGTT